MKLIRILVGLLAVWSAGGASAQAHFGGAVTADVRLTAEFSPYLVGESIDVKDGATLSIDPGVTLLFEPGMGLTVTKGALIARGDPERRIVFGSASEYSGIPGSPGSWGAVVFSDETDDAATLLASVDIRYGSGVHLQSASPTFEDVNITENAGGAVERDRDSRPNIRGLQARGNERNGVGRSNASEHQGERGRRPAFAGPRHPPGPPSHPKPPRQPGPRSLPAPDLRLSPLPTAAPITKLAAPASPKVAGVCPASSELALPIAVDGAPVDVVIDTPYEDGWLKFEGSAGQRVTLTGIDNTFVYDGLYVHVYRPDANGAASVNNGTVTSWEWLGPYDPDYDYQDDFVDMDVLPADGTYLIHLDPYYTAETGQVTVRLYDAGTRAQAPFTLPGVQTFDIQVPGQCVTSTFEGAVGQSLNVTRLAGSFPASHDVELDIYYPAADGSASTSSGWHSSKWFYVDGFYALPRLPVGGTYTAMVCEWWDGVGTANFQFDLRPDDLSANVGIDGAAASLASVAPGQRMYFDFSASAGQRIAVVLAESGLASPANMTLLQRTANGGLAGQAYYGNVGAGYSGDLFVVPITGNYTVSVTPSGTEFGSAAVQLVTVPLGAAQPIALDTLKSVSSSTALVFDGTAGQALRIVATNESFSSSVRYVVYLPDGGGGASSASGTLYQTYSYYSSNYSLNLPLLPISGQYTLAIDPAAGSSGGVDLKIIDLATITPPTPPTGPGDLTLSMAIGESVDVPANAPEQNVRITFNANAGDQFNLATVQHTFSTSYSHPLRIHPPCAAPWPN
jgi:hypothetical protein